MDPLNVPRADGLGNLSYVCTGPAGTYLLKLYRTRRGRFLDYIEPTYSKYVLRRTSGTPAGRYESERDNLAVWTREGFDVCRVFELPLPEGIEPPALWLEYVPGRLLDDVLRDPELEWDQKTGDLTVLATELGRRHARAFETGERRLLQKHGGGCHVMLFEGRQITIDLEGAYLPGHRLEAALTRELSGYLRSFFGAFGDRFGESLEVFLAAYPEPDILRATLDWRLRGQGLVGSLTRYRDRRRRGAGSKFGLLSQLGARL